jgi:outer membrane protein assembly factor BamB
MMPVTTLARGSNPRSFTLWPALLLGALAPACSQPIELDWKHDIGASSVSTPLVTDAFIAFGHDRGVSLVDKHGSQRCRFETAGEIISKPATDGRLIFVGCTNYLVYAIDQQCKQAWKFTTGDRIKSDPLAADGRVFVSSYDGHVYALNAASGELAWSFPALTAPAPEQAVSAPAAPPAAPEPPAKAKKARGKRKVPAPVVAAPQPEPAAPAPVAAPLAVGDFSYSSLVLADGVLYVGNLDGYLYALSAADGALRWRYRTDAAITSTPLVADGRLYVGSNDGGIYALELPQGAAEPRLLWKHGTAGWVNSSARLADGVLYIGGNDRHLYALDAAKGEVKWSFETKGPAISTPAIYKNLVLVAGASGDGAIYAIDRPNGALFWSYQTGGKVESDPIVVGDQLFVTSTDQSLYAFTVRKTALK